MSTRLVSTYDIVQPMNFNNLYVGLPGFLNPSIVTGDKYRPDLLLTTKDNCLYILELTVGYETNLQNNIKRKQEKYTDAIKEQKKHFKSVEFINLSSKYCKDWKEYPPEDYMEKYFLLLNEECFFEILTENKFNAGNYIPSWVYNIMMKHLFSTMAQYRKSKDPLTLLQLCRRTLQHGQHQEVLAGLRFYFEKIKDPHKTI